MNNWEKVTLGEIIISANTGLDAIKRAPIVDIDTGIKCIRIQDISQSKKYENWGYTNVDEKNFKKFQLKQNDIIIARTGATIGVNIRIKNDLNAVYNNGLIRIRVNNQICNPIYLYYNIRTSNYYGFIDSISGGTSSQPNMQINALLRFEINLPPLDEQKRIADVLSALDDKIEINNKINENLEAQAQAIFKRWFVDFEFPDQEGKPYKTNGGKFIDSELGEIPFGWKVGTLRDYCSSASVKHDFKKEKLIFLNTGDIEKGKFLHSNFMKVSDMPGQAKKNIKEGDILYSEIRPINLHYAFVNFKSDDYVVSTKLMVIRSINIDNRRLYNYLTSTEIINKLQTEAESRSGTFPQIRFENIQNLLIVIGNDNVEKKYSKILHSIYNKIDENISEDQKLSDIRDSLLPKLMSGEVRV